MNNLEKLEKQLKEAKKVVWPNSRQDNVVKLVFEMADHIKSLYKIYASMDKDLECLQEKEVEKPKRGRKKKNENED